MLTRSGLVQILCVFTSLAGARAHAFTRVLADCDGTIVDDESPRSTWVRPYYLKRVEQLRNTLQPDPQQLGLPDVIAVSVREYLALAPKLARGPGELNWLKPVPLERDPLNPGRPTSFIPGYYYLSPELSYADYRPADGRRSALLRAGKNAIRRTQILRDEHRGRRPAEEIYDWQGKAFCLVQRLMERPATVGNLAIFTAGNHHEWEWDGLFGLWRRVGLIKHARGRDGFGNVTKPRIFTVSDPGALRYGRDSFPERKSELVRATAEEMADISRGKHFELSTDPREAARGINREGHTLIVAENDPAMLSEIRKRLTALSGEYHIGHQVKFVLLNASESPDDFNELWPHEWTVFHRRVPRAARPEEIARWTGVNCEEFFE